MYNHAHAFNDLNFKGLLQDCYIYLSIYLYFFNIIQIQYNIRCKLNDVIIINLLLFELTYV